MVAFERKNDKRARKERVAFYWKKLHKMQSAVRCFSYQYRFLKGKKGMIKFQAVYRMANVLFFFPQSERGLGISCEGVRSKS
jgi:hypothetical protein